MQALVQKLEELQSHYIDRHGQRIDYVDAPIATIVQSQRENLSPEIFMQFARAAEAQTALHDAMIAQFGKPLSRFQREDDLFLVLELADALSRRRILDIKLSSGGLLQFDGNEVLLGTAPMRRFNARVGRGDRPRKFFILLDDEVPIAVTKIASCFSEVIQSGEAGIRLVEDSEAIDRGLSQRLFMGVGQVLIAMLTNGHSKDAEAVSHPEAFQETFVKITRGAIEFVLVHELSHIQLGHLTDGDALEKAMSPNEIVEWTTTQQHEFDADARALQLLSNASPSNSLLSGLAFSIPLALYAAIDTLILFRQSDDPGAVDTDRLAYVGPTHPSPTHRIARVRSQLAERTHTQFQTGFDFGVETMLTIAQRIDVLLRDFDKQRELELHPRWNLNLSLLAVAANASESPPGGILYAEPPN